VEARGALSAKGNAELTLHDEMLRRVAALEEAIAKLAVTKPGIGHNNPPERIDPFGDEERHAVETAISVLNAQSPKPETLPVEASEAAAKLMTVGARLKAYALKQGDVFVSEAFKSAGSEFGKQLIRSPLWLPLPALLIAAAQAAYAWIASLPAPPH
jgi:hypothetical protein